MTGTDATDRPGADDAAPADPLAGDWTIYRAAELHAELLRRLAAGDDTLDLGGVETIDCAGLQLLIAARRSAREAGLPLRIVRTPAAVRRFCEELAAAHVLEATEAA